MKLHLFEGPVNNLIFNMLNPELLCDISFNKFSAFIPIADYYLSIASVDNNKYIWIILNKDFTVNKLSDEFILENNNWNNETIVDLCFYDLNLYLKTVSNFIYYIDFSNIYDIFPNVEFNCKPINLQTDEDIILNVDIEGYPIDTCHVENYIINDKNNITPHGYIKINNTDRIFGYSSNNEKWNTVKIQDFIYYKPLIDLEKDKKYDLYYYDMMPIEAFNELSVGDKINQCKFMLITIDKLEMMTMLELSHIIEAHTYILCLIPNNIDNLKEMIDHCVYCKNEILLNSFLNLLILKDDKWTDFLLENVFKGDFYLNQLKAMSQYLNYFKENCTYLHFYKEKLNLLVKD